MEGKRVHELSKELGLSSEALVKLLKSMGFNLKGYMSILSNKEIQALRAKLAEKRESSRIADAKKQRIRKKRIKTIQRRKEWKREVDQKKVVAKVKETLAKMGGERTKKKKPKIRKVEDKKEEKKIRVGEFTSISDLAHAFNIDPLRLISKCMELGLMVTINQRLDFDTVVTIADEYGYEAELISYYEEEKEQEEFEKLQKRPPVITIMGHVDHGKTSLLDNIRKTHVTKSEKGGITQHIGAYKIDFNGKEIVFIDTPGHEAFTAMRARGAQVTDIVVLVIAADDGIMPQTIECLNHARDAGVPIIVAINKIDLEGIDIDKVKHDLMEHNVQLEKHGGDTMVCPVSAKTSEGIGELLNAIIMQADMEELTASRDGPARGTVIEARLDKGKGPVATVLVTKGTLKHGDTFLTGTTCGKVKTMFNEWGETKNNVLPSDPIQVVGFEETPHVGDTFVVFEDEQQAREIARKRKMAAKEEMRKEKQEMTLEQVQEELQKGKIEELKVIIKGDVGGSIEALADSIQSLVIKDIKAKVIHKAIGEINQSDVLLASASNAIIVGYHVKESIKARKLAKEREVTIRKYNIIYEAIDDLKLAMEGLFVPEYEQIELGKAKVKQVFKIKDFGFIAGVIVLSGKVIKGEKIRIKRQDELVYEGKISSLKKFQEEVKEVESGIECGIALSGSFKPQKDDIIEIYTVQEVSK